MKSLVPDLFDDPGLDRTLFGDVLTYFLTTFLDGPTNTKYNEYTTIAGMTSIASFYVIGIAANNAIILTFSV